MDSGSGAKVNPQNAIKFLAVCRKLLSSHMCVDKVFPPIFLTQRKLFPKIIFEIFSTYLVKTKVLLSFPQGTFEKKIWKFCYKMERMLHWHWAFHWAALRVKHPVYTHVCRPPFRGKTKKDFGPVFVPERVPCPHSQMKMHQALEQKLDSENFRPKWHATPMGEIETWALGSVGVW